MRSRLGQGTQSLNQSSDSTLLLCFKCIIAWSEFFSNNWTHLLGDKSDKQKRITKTYEYGMAREDKGKYVWKRIPKNTTQRSNSNIWKLYG